MPQNSHSNQRRGVYCVRCDDMLDGDVKNAASCYQIYSKSKLSHVDAFKEVEVS